MIDERPIREIEADMTLEEIFSYATDVSDGRFDKPLIPWVWRINEMGVETMQSCSGHPREENRGYLSEGHLSFIIPTDFDIPIFVHNLAGALGITLIQRSYHPWRGMMVGFFGKSESEESMGRSMDLIEHAIALAEATNV